MDEVKYRYPDEGDGITLQLISETEKFDDYWYESERGVLEEINRAIENNISRRQRTMLDAGCGEGRLLEYFAPLFSQVVGIDPDAERYKSAVEAVGKNNLSACSVHNVSLEEFANEQKFDFVLSSHIIQHIPTPTLDNHLRMLTERVSNDGLVVINTCHSTTGNDYFTSSSKDPETGKLVEKEIDEETFNHLAVNGVGDKLPAHIFSAELLESKMRILGFELISDRVYHMRKEIQNRYGKDVDSKVNSDLRLKNQCGRDMSLVFRKMLVVEDGCMNIMSVFGADLFGADENKIRELFEENLFGIEKKNTKKSCLKNLFCADKKRQATLTDKRSKFSDIIGHDFANEQCRSTTLNMEKCACKCFAAGDNFMKTHGIANELTRIYIGHTFFKFSDKHTAKLQFFLTLYPYRNVCILNCNIELKDIDIDSIIRMRHLTGCGEKIREDFSKFFSSSGDKELPTIEFGCISSLNLTIMDYARELFNVLGYNEFPKEKAGCYRNECCERPKILVEHGDSINPNDYCLHIITEIKETNNRHENVTAHDWTCANANAIYGLLTGDEGFSFVPHELAAKRVQTHWTSRDFVDVVAYGFGVVLVNWKGSSLRGRSYMDYQRHWRVNDSELNLAYFTCTPCMAGLDHGILKTAERNLVIYFENEYLVKHNDIRDNDINTCRRKLQSFIKSTMDTIEELKGLFELIATESGTVKSIETIQKKLDIQYEDSNMLYQKRNNAIIGALTVLSLVLAVIALQRGSYLLDMDFTGLHIAWIIGIPAMFIVAILMIKLYCRKE